MTARIITKPTTFEVWGTVVETAPILAWIADQAPSARLKFETDGDDQRLGQYFTYEVWFEDQTDEVNFKMFQSDGFEAHAAELAEAVSQHAKVQAHYTATQFVINPLVFKAGR